MAEKSQTVEENKAEREQALESLRSAGKAYPNAFRPTHTVAAAATLEPDREVAVAGRLELKRTAGKATFATLAGSGIATAQIQLYASARDGELLDWLNAAHIGDVIGVAGTLFRTKKGELTIQLKAGEVLASCLQPYSPKNPPAPERLQKRRYLAFALQPQLRRQMAQRFELIDRIRDNLNAQGFMECETPMLHPVQGGAAAKPFTTMHETLDRKLYLRIAPELYLKRLLVGGFDKVYEINRSFRNEGMSERHNPEFTMLELYQTYAGYQDLMRLLEDLFRHLTGTNWLESDDFTAHQATIDGRPVEIPATFKKQTLRASLAERLQVGAAQVNDARYLAGCMEGVEGAKAQDAGTLEDVGRMQMLLFEKEVEKTLIEPTFITEFPASVSPLSRRSDADPQIAERFELFIGGREIANGFSELNDPDEQERVFREQVERGKRGDAEAMQFDEDYITALRYGMPPAAGLGLGIDRLAMLLLQADSIRDVIAFPLLRPEAPSKD